MPRSPTIRTTGWLLLAAAWVVVAGLLTARLAGQALDDVFITYRYAQNFAAGEGLVFNPGERIFGTTAPGWALLLGLLQIFTTVPVHVLGTVLTALALLALGGLLALEGQRLGRTPEALVAGSLVLTSTYFWLHNGLELLPSLAILLLAARLTPRSQSRPNPRPGASTIPAHRRRLVTAGLLAGSAVWLRPEIGLGAGLLGLLLLWEEGRPREAGRGLKSSLPMTYGLTVAAVVTAGLLAAATWFETVLPQTLAAKRIQGAWAAGAAEAGGGNAGGWQSGTDFWLEGLRWLRLSYTTDWIATGVFVAGGLAGMTMLLRSGSRPLRLLAAYALALVVVYPLLQVPFYTWYSIPVLVALTYGLTFGAGAVVRRLLSLAHASRSRVSAAAMMLLAVAVVTIAGLPALRASERMADGYRSFQEIPLYRAYRDTGEWLAANTPAETSVAYVEVGTVAYFSHRPVFDLLGLVTPGVLTAVSRRDLEHAFLTSPADYVLDSGRVHGLMAQVVSRPWFSSFYEEVARIPIPGGQDTVIIYRRSTGHPLPEPPPPRPPSLGPRDASPSRK
jgi:hypothetical protein